MLLSTALFPPIQFFSKIIDQDGFSLESRENYQERSYRNRYVVSGANGPIRLSVPIVKGKPTERLIKDVKIDQSDNWCKIHLKTVQSAYKHSPYYDFYFDELHQFWEKKWKYLFEYNLEILEVLLDIMDLDIKISETSEYQVNPIDSQFDFREHIHPKLSWEKDPDFHPQVYTQNFSDRREFIPNLSIIDLIFQVGPDASRIIRNSIFTKT